MFEKYNEALSQFNMSIKGYFNENNKFLESLNYSIDDGKRIRPIILQEVFKMLSGHEVTKTVLDFSIALEFIHSYSLVHDDLPDMDNSDYRRDRLTVHKKFGPDIAILSGDALLNKAYELMLINIVNQEDFENLRFASKAAYTIAQKSGLEGMIKGQVLDVLELSKSKHDIIDMYIGKTCGLIMAATEAGAYLAKQDDRVVKDMSDLGKYIGLAFQLQDDLLDKEDDESIGKNTYITMSSVEETKKKIKEYSDLAIQILNKYQASDFLKNLVNELINREF